MTNRASTRSSKFIPIDFSGRVGRWPFALVAFAYGILVPVLIDVLVLCAARRGVTLPTGDVMPMMKGLNIPSSLALPILILDGVVLTVIGVVYLSIEVRRLHDMNVTGYLVLGYLVLMAVPFPNIAPLPPIAFFLWAVPLAIVPGTNGPNAYGMRQTTL